MILPLLALPDGFHPVTPEGEAHLLSKRGTIVKVEFVTPRLLKTRQQEKFWHGVIVPMILACWKQAQEWSIEPNHDMVHGRLVAAVFGEVDTPLGKERMSSRNLTIDQYSQLIEAGTEHLHTKFNVTAPKPDDRWDL